MHKVALTSESTGKMTTHDIYSAGSNREAASVAYNSRYGVILGRDSVRPRGMDITDTDLNIIGTAGAVTRAVVFKV